MELCFPNIIYGGSFIRKQSESVMDWNYQNANCRLIKKNIVSFIATFGTLSFAVCDAFAWTITGKHDVIDKNRKYVTYRNAAGRETTRHIYDKRSQITCSENLVKRLDRWDMLAERQTNRQTDNNPLLYCSWCSVGRLRILCYSQLGFNTTAMVGWVGQ